MNTIVECRFLQAPGFHKLYSRALLYAARSRVGE